MNADAIQIALGTLQGLLSSTGFVLALFIGFCVLFGFTKTKKTAGGSASVVKSLDERISRQPMAYFGPGIGRQKVDQLHSPELLEAAARK
jgi:acid phosphatase family membrane protein YuiD